jgi:hypothetical protein
VCGPNCGNETEMVKLDYKAENDTSLWSQWLIKEQNRKIVWIDVFDSVHHFEEQ